MWEEAHGNLYILIVGFVCNFMFGQKINYSSIKCHIKSLLECFWIFRIILTPQIRA
jgi:uncharacterized membrane protein